MLARVGNESFWVTQSPVTDIGSASDEIDQLPADVAELRRLSSGLVFHYRAGGDFAENGIAAERIAEIDSRYADVMLDRLHELGGPVTARREPAQRLVGCCRDFTVLFVSMARQQGVPARSRVGFATYFEEGWLIDHVVAEVWDAARRRWRLVEPQVSDEFAAAAGFDPMDVPSEAFLTGGVGWLRARAGDLDPERFVVAPELDIPETRGWHYLRHNLVHDLATLTKQEMVLWDAWGIVEQRTEPDQAEAEMLDDLAQVVSAPDPDPATLQAWARRQGLAVPRSVNSYSPANRGEPRRLELRQPAER
jgi:hypothetical protein